MTDVQRGEITRLLQAVSSGDNAAVDELFELVYDDLRRAAASVLRRECAGHTLQPTALVHETFLRLFDAKFLQQSTNRAVFSARHVARCDRSWSIMREQRNAAKRGGRWHRTMLDDCLGAFEKDHIDLEPLGEAMAQLERLHSRQHHIIDMRYFGGFSVKEIADMLQVSLSTVEKDLHLARAFLYGELDR